MKIKLLGIIMIIGILMTTIANANDGISIIVDGNVVETDTSAQIIEGRTMVPLRAIFEALGADVEWNGEEKSIKAQKDNISISMKIDSNIFVVDGDMIFELDVPMQIINSRTMVPARAVAESFDCEVEWDSLSKTVIITTIKDIEITTETTTETTTITTSEATTETITEEEWIKYFMSNDDKPEPIDDSKFKDEISKEYHIKARKSIVDKIYFLNGYDDYLYDSKAHNLYLDITTNNKKLIDEYIEKLWEKATFVNRELYLRERNSTDREIHLEVTGAGLYLYIDKNMGYSCTKYNDDVNVILFSFADEEVEGIASYTILFVKRDQKVLQYNLIRENDGSYSIMEANIVIKSGLENDKKNFLYEISKIVKTVNGFNGK